MREGAQVISLARAREKSAAARELLAEGIDPREAERAERANVGAA
jgi:hypothetical protein